MLQSLCIHGQESVCFERIIFGALFEAIIFKARRLKSVLPSRRERSFHVSQDPCVGVRFGVQYRRQSEPYQFLTPAMGQQRLSKKGGEIRTASEDI